MTNTRTEANILADTYENARTLTRWYLARLKEVDMHKVFEAEGKKLNSAYWITAHLAWSEQFMLLLALGGKPLDIHWMEQFRIGSKYPDDITALPPIKQILDAWKEIHVAAMAHVRSLPDDMMNRDNPAGFGFGGDNSYRMMIHHAILHEAVHAGIFHGSANCMGYRRFDSIIR